MKKDEKEKMVVAKVAPIPKNGIIIDEREWFGIHVKGKKKQKKENK